MATIRQKNNSEPDTPPSGYLEIYGNETTKTLEGKDDTGLVTAYGDTKKTLVSSNDTTENFLGNKIQGGTGVNAVIKNAGGDEYLEFSSSALGDLYPTGLISGESLDGGVVSINSGDATLFDIVGCTYFIRGVAYAIASQTGVDPSFGAGENSSFIGLDSNGFTYSSTTWSHTQLQTIVPVSRVNAASGQTGSGSTIALVRDDRFFIDQQGLHRRYYHEHVFGALYHKGGLITASSTALQLDQASGTLFDAQGKEQLLSSIGDLDAIKVFHTGGAPATLLASPLIVDTANYDNGTDLTAIPSNKWVCHTLLKSPKAGGGFFFIYGTEIFNNQTEARASGVTWSIFVDQATSGLIPVARIVVQQGATVIADGDVRDERPFAVGGSGGATTSAVHTMDQAYEASTAPQIHLNSTQGGIDIRDASTPLGTDLWTVKDSAGTTTFFAITENGIESIIVTQKQMDMLEKAAPTVSAAGSGRMYFDSISKTFKVSEDGGAYLDAFGVSIPDHNNTTNKDGGTTGEYYHMTSAQHTIATQAATALLSGYMTAIDQAFAGAKTFEKLIIDQGLLTALPFSFDGDPDTGIYSVGANQMAFVAAAVEKLTISTSQMKANVPIRAANGTVLLPAFSFIGQTNGGFYRLSTDNSLRMSVEGVDSMIWTADNLVGLPNLPEYADDTAAGVGGLATGILYRTATGEMRIKL